MSKRKGNVVDPFLTLNQYGADATRWYLISNADPWENLKFDLDGITEVRNKFLERFIIPIPFCYLCQHRSVSIRCIKSIAPVNSLRNGSMDYFAITIRNHFVSGVYG